MINLTKNLITIKQFINKSLGEWKSIRSTHSLAFQEFENSTSKIIINNIETENSTVIKLLKRYNLNPSAVIKAISISWQATSDWDENQRQKEDKTILVFSPKNINTGIVLRSKGYTESLISSSEYLIDENNNLNLKTIYNSTIAEERISFLSSHIRSRFSVIRDQNNKGVIQTSHTSEIRNLSILKD